MALFGKKAACGICGDEAGKYKVADGWICKNCYKECGYNFGTPIKGKSLEIVRGDLEAVRSNMEVFSKFTPTKAFPTLIEFDDNKKQWLIPDGMFGKKKNPVIRSYSDILDFELLEDGETITKGGLGRAVAGGVLLGGVGAVVGGVTGKKNKAMVNSLKIKITLNDLKEPTVYIKFINAATKKDSFTYKSLYKSAQEIMSVLSVIKGQNSEPTQVQSEGVSVADEILKFKSLLDSGIITQEEFDIKKKELLNI